MALIIAFAFITPIYAKFSISFLSGRFTSVCSWESTDKAYTSFTVTIINQLVYNESAGDTDFAQISLSNSSDYSTQKSIDIKFFKDGTFQVWLSSCGSCYQIGYGSWSSDEPLVVSLDSSNILNVGNSTHPDAYMEDFGIGVWEGGLKYIGAYGSQADASNVVTGGYVTVEVNPYQYQATSLIEQITPILVLAISLSIVGAVIGKITKKL